MTEFCCGKGQDQSQEQWSAEQLPMGMWVTGATWGGDTFSEALSTELLV